MDSSAKSFYGYDLSFLDEPIIGVALATPALGFREALLVCTEKRLIYIRKRRGKLTIDRNYEWQAITQSSLKRTFGIWYFKVKTNKYEDEYTGKRSELSEIAKIVKERALQISPDFFILKASDLPKEPGLDSDSDTSSQSERTSSQRKQDSAQDTYIPTHRETGSCQEFEIQGYDLSSVGELVEFAATVMFGSRRGVLAITPTRFLFIRRDYGGVFINHEYYRETINVPTLVSSEDRHFLIVKSETGIDRYSGERHDLERIVALVGENEVLAQHATDVNISPEPDSIKRRETASDVATTYGSHKGRSDTALKDQQNETKEKHTACLKVGTVIVWMVLLILIFAWIGRCGAEDGRLEEYCSYKFSDGSYFYEECIDEGWKDWYGNAHWMK